MTREPVGRHDARVKTIRHSLTVGLGTEQVGHEKKKYSFSEEKYINVLKYINAIIVNMVTN